MFLFICLFCICFRDVGRQILQSSVNRMDVATCEGMIFSYSNPFSLNVTLFNHAPTAGGEAQPHKRIKEKGHRGKVERNLMFSFS